MNRVRGLGLPAHVKARIVKSLHSVGLYGAEVGGIPKSGMNKLHMSARKAFGKGAGLRRSAPLELMAHGEPTADPQVSADLSMRVWNRRILARKQCRKLEWPLEPRLWDDALKPGRGRGPMRNLKQLAVRLGWLPALGGWTCQGQWFSSDEATLRAKWDSAQVLCADVASTRKDFEGLASGLSTSAYRQLKLDGQSQKEDRKAALNAALGPWRSLA
eukprot:4076908-Amphidinium_carterae.1